MSRMFGGVSDVEDVRGCCILGDVSLGDSVCFWNVCFLLLLWFLAGYVWSGLIRRIYAGGVLVVEGVRSDVPFVVVVPFSVLRCHVGG
jgi:hypothetical protein